MFGFGFIVGAASVGAVWYFLPKISAWVSSVKAKI